MRRSTRTLRVGVLFLSLLVLGACHGEFKQTFERVGSPDDTLTLKSTRGWVHPASGFPNNVVFRIFGTEETSGTYEMKTGDDTVTGSFTAGKDGEKQWIRFTPSDTGKGKAWEATVKFSGMLVDRDGKFWSLKTADARAASSVRIGE